jgi:hypothetical protein
MNIYVDSDWYLVIEWRESESTYKVNTTTGLFEEVIN